MFYLLFAHLGDKFILFNLFRYLTFRSVGGTLTALLICFLIGPRMILWLKSKQAGATNIRAYLEETHAKKAGTPSMGGLMILIAVTVSTLLWANLSDTFVWYALLVLVGYGLVGFGDDYLKLTKKNSKGLPGRRKLLAQVIIGLAATAGIMSSLPPDMNMNVAIPFFKHTFLYLSWAFVPWAVVVMVGASNAVNLTDGLDGLAIVPVAIASACFGLISYLTGNEIYAHYLNIPSVPGAGELCVICGALVGGGMGFLWYNAPPAQVFMGDTGSLAMGGMLGAMALMTKNEIVLAIIGGLFVLETVSVIVQVISFKTTGKRVFAMAPLHHHFEKKGWSETTIVIRFWIIAVILALVGLSTLKLR
jgi:phospho-N-acetylmuramoyl-pentapeptide-transferase